MGFKSINRNLIYTRGILSFSSSSLSSSSSGQPQWRQIYKTERQHNRLYSTTMPNTALLRPTWVMDWTGRNIKTQKQAKTKITSSSSKLFSSSASPVTLDESSSLSLPTNEDNEKRLLKMRHTSAHVLAMAVQNLFPNAKVAIGPWIENGFYYDFSFGEDKLMDIHLKEIQQEMNNIIKQKLPLIKEEVTREEAKRRILALPNSEPYKLQILDSIPENEKITIYHIGDQWWDLCAGPHVDHTGHLKPKALSLEKITGAYWRGDVNQEMLTRIYGTAWEDKKQMKLYRDKMAEAAKRDHRLVGKQLDLFSLQEDAGGGLVFWHPKGATIRHEIETFWKDSHIKNGYELVVSPHVAKTDLWNVSGHLDFYKDSMFDSLELENESYQIKPMNCPFHCLMYKDKAYSYRELPIRWAELGTVYRYESSGSLHGLFRVRGFTQDDAHIFCLPDQVEDEIVSVLDLTESILSRFGFSDYEINLSTRPEKYVGSDNIWTLSMNALKGALDRKGWNYIYDDGGGAFYGPKIDIKIKDAIGRTWQCSTIQCDFNLPERFDLTYMDSQNQKQRPIMIHRAIFGSIERFLGILMENTCGDFPLWLAPVQLRLIPVSDHYLEFCEDLKKKAIAMGIRCEIRSNERLNKLIRNSEIDKIPILGIVGEKEVESGNLAIRLRKGKDVGPLSINTVFNTILETSQKRKHEESGNIFENGKTD